MVFQHDDYAEGRLQSSQLFRNRFGRYKTPFSHLLNHYVAKYQDKIRLLGVGHGYDFLQLAKTPVGRTNVKVGHYCDLKSDMLRMPGPYCNCPMNYRET